MGKQRSYKGKKQYGSYKTENRVLKNKIKKLERHVKRHPQDEEGAKNLARIKKDGYKVRQKPREPGSNQTRPFRIVHVPPTVTAGEQLAKLLGIPMPKVRRRTKKAKAPVTVKKRKDVKKP